MEIQDDRYGGRVPSKKQKAKVAISKKKEINDGDDDGVARWVSSWWT